MKEKVRKRRKREKRERENLQELLKSIKGFMATPQVPLVLQISERKSGILVFVFKEIFNFQVAVLIDAIIVWRVALKGELFLKKKKGGEKRRGNEKKNIQHVYSSTNYTKHFEKCSSFRFYDKERPFLPKQPHLHEGEGQVTEPLGFYPKLEQPDELPRDGFSSFCGYANKGRKK